MNGSSATVHVVDDDTVILESLTALFETAGFAAKAYDRPQKLLDADDVAPGCLVLDVRMPGMTGFELFQQMRHRHPDLPVLFITAHAEVRSAVQAMKDGAVDLLEKPVSHEVLLLRVRAAVERGRRQARERRLQQELREQISRLTKRECEVLSYVCEGATSKQTADKLGIAVKTVEVHRSHIMDKMQATNVADLVRRVSEGGVRPEDLR
jgi:FixJ family two-component response regulator